LYYEYKLELKDLQIKDMIKEVLRTHKYYGHKRIALELGLNKKRILRVMKKYNIVALRLKKKPYKKEDQNKADTNIPNLIKTMCPLAPNVIWSCDFTYIPYKNSFIYLATVLDIYTREIIGISVSKYHNADLVTKALIDALSKEDVPIYVHTDQGSEYTSKQYINLLQTNEIIFSNSAKASPWENGYQESFYSQFKLDLGDTNRFNGIGELIEEIEHMIYRHNNIKTHSVLKTNPVNYRKLWESKVLSFSEDKLFNKLGT